MKEIILISGPPRSGTTLVGNLIGSCELVEYFFEPPTLNNILRLFGNHQDDQGLRQLFRNYLKYELLFESLAGRRLNFNKNDDTYILSRLSSTEVKFRLSRSWRSHELEQLSSDKKLAFKTPGVGNWLIHLAAQIEGLKVILLIRHPNALIESILKKGWFNPSCPASIRDTVIYKNHHIPEIIPKTLYEDFVTANEVRRIVIYLEVQFRLMEKFSDSIIIEYEGLVQDKELRSKFYKGIGVRQTQKTAELEERIVAAKAHRGEIKLEVGSHEKSLFALYDKLKKRSFK